MSGVPSVQPRWPCGFGHTRNKAHRAVQADERRSAQKRILSNGWSKTAGLAGAIKRCDWRRSNCEEACIPRGSAIAVILQHGRWGVWNSSTVGIVNAAPVGYFRVGGTERLLRQLELQ